MKYFVNSAGGILFNVNKDLKTSRLNHLIQCNLVHMWFQIRILRVVTLTLESICKLEITNKISLRDCYSPVHVFILEGVRNVWINSVQLFAETCFTTFRNDGLSRNIIKLKSVMACLH